MNKHLPRRAILFCYIIVIIYHGYRYYFYYLEKVSFNVLILSSNKTAQKLWTELLGEFESRGNYA